MTLTGSRLALRRGPVFFDLFHAPADLDAQDSPGQTPVVPGVPLDLHGYGADDSLGLDAVLQTECLHDKWVSRVRRYSMLNLFLRILGFSGGEVDALGTPRSPGWKALRREHLSRNPRCAVCGSDKNVVPHHVVPFHIDQSRELDPSNLVTLCESPTFNCHLFFGHLRRWDRHNPTVVEDAAEWNRKISQSPG